MKAIIPVGDCKYLTSLFVCNELNGSSVTWIFAFSRTEMLSFEFVIAEPQIFDLNQRATLSASCRKSKICDEAVLVDGVPVHVQAAEIVRFVIVAIHDSQNIIGEFARANNKLVAFRGRSKPRYVSFHRGRRASR